MAQLSHLYMTTGKTIALTRRTFAGKVMSLLFNMLSQFVAAFIPRSKSFNFIAAVTICSDFGVQENKVSHCFHCFPIYLRWSGRTRWHYLHFWMFGVKPAFSLSSFTFIKRLFSFSSLRVVSSAYLRLLIFLPAILIPAYAPYSLAFCKMYSAYKLNEHGDNVQPLHPPFPIWNQSIVPCPLLPVASWLGYRFLRRQVMWSGIPISWRIFNSLLWSAQSKALA